MRLILLFLKKYHPVPAFVWGLFICILTCLPSSTIPNIYWHFIFGLDKWVHFLLFSCFAFLIVAGLHLKTHKILTHAALFAFSFALFLGCITELLQQYVLESRSGDEFDLLADAFGAFFGVVIYYGIVFWYRFRIFRN